jgi:hypothetical protein
MLDIGSITAQVKNNCNISDARHWGLYSPCGLLLRLRDLYKIEHGLKPWSSVSHRRIGEWIDKREQLWDGLSEAEYERIEIKGRLFWPFDVKGINNVLHKVGYFYGAGYGYLMKPLFLLAELNEKKKIGSHQIFFAQRELARDLSTSPAMIQGNTIIARHETMEYFLWDRLEEMKTKPDNSALCRAFSEYGLTKEADSSASKKFQQIVRDEMTTYIHHEVGEASQRRNLGRWWKELIQKLPYSRAEMFLRALKDILADTCDSGMLPYIIKKSKRGSLFFYIALLKGFRKNMVKEIITAYEEFTGSGDWGVIEKARRKSYISAKEHVKTLKNLYKRGNVTHEKIEEEFLKECN